MCFSDIAGQWSANPHPQTYGLPPLPTPVRIQWLSGCSQESWCSPRANLPRVPRWQTACTCARDLQTLKHSILYMALSHSGGPPFHCSFFSPRLHWGCSDTPADFRAAIGVASRNRFDTTRLQSRRARTRPTNAGVIALCTVGFLFFLFSKRRLFVPHLNFLLCLASTPRHRIRLAGILSPLSTECVVHLGAAERGVWQR